MIRRRRAGLTLEPGESVKTLTPITFTLDTGHCCKKLKYSLKMLLCSTGENIELSFTSLIILGHMLSATVLGKDIDKKKYFHYGKCVRKDNFTNVINVFVYLVWSSVSPQ